MVSGEFFNGMLFSVGSWQRIVGSEQLAVGSWQLPVGKGLGNY